MPDLAPDFRRIPLAHRGLHGAGRPENSLAAARAAIAAGYGIECDLQLAADGVPMVFHDEDLGRLTGRTGRVGALTAAELARLPLGGTAETIPTLADLLDLVAGRVPLLIEVKDQTGTLSPGPDRLEEATAAVLAAYRGPVALMSFNPHSMAALARLAPGIARGLTSCAFPARDWPLPAERRAALAALGDFDAVGASFVSHDRADLANPAVLALKARGLPILCWTVRSAEAEARARAIADNITFEGYMPAIPAA